MDLWVGGRTLRLEVTGGKSRGSDGGRRLAAAGAEGNGPEEEKKAKEESPLCFVILRLKLCGGTLQILNISSHESFSEPVFASSPTTAKADPGSPMTVRPESCPHLNTTVELKRRKRGKKKASTLQFFFFLKISWPI